MRIGDCRDSAEAALVRAVMDAHGIDVYISGEHHAAMVGLGASAIDQAIWVPAGDADEARALLRELREGGEAALADDEIPADDASVRDDEVAPGGALVVSGEDTLARLGRRNRIALALLVGLTVGHGTAHMSTRAWMRGFTLAAIQIVGWFRLGTNVALGVALVLGAIAADLAGALWEILRSPATVPRARALAPPRRPG